MHRSALSAVALLFALTGSAPVGAQTDTAAIRAISPNGGEAFAVGETMRIRWYADTTRVASCTIMFSADSGLTWENVTESRAIVHGHPDWGAYDWVVPESLDQTAVVSSGCLLMIYDYSGTSQDMTDGYFAVTETRSGDAPSDSPCGTGAGLALLPPLVWRTCRRHGEKSPRKEAPHA